MLYTAWIAYDNGTQRDCRKVSAHRIDLLMRRANEACRDLLNTYYKPEVQRKVTENFNIYKPLPLVGFGGAIWDMAREARRKVQKERWTAAEQGDMHWPLSYPLDKYFVTIRAEK